MIMGKWDESLENYVEDSENGLRISLYNCY